MGGFWLILVVTGVHVAQGHNPNWRTLHSLGSPPNHEQRVQDIVVMWVRHLCVSNLLNCGQHGTCAVDTKGYIGCRCDSGGKFVWGGKLCGMKGEMLPIPSEYIIGLSLGAVIALVVVILFIVADAYFGCRRRLGGWLHSGRRDGEHNDQPYTVRLSRATQQMVSPVSHTITSEQLETAFPADAAGELPAYSDAVQSSPGNSPTWSDSIMEQASSAIRRVSDDVQATSNEVSDAVQASSNEVSDDVQAFSNEASDNVQASSNVTSDEIQASSSEASDDVQASFNASSSSSVTLAAGSTASSAIASDVLYRDRYFRCKSRERKRRRKAHEDDNLRKLFTLPRIGSQHEANELEARSNSSLACEDILSQLSDTYYNRWPPIRPVNSTVPARYPQGTRNPATVDLSPERTYRVLLMGSMDPQPLFLYEPWRSTSPSADTHQRTPSQPAHRQPHYRHCTDVGCSPTVVQGTVDSPWHARRPGRTDESFPGAISGADSHTEVSDPHWEKRFPDQLSDSSNETLVAGSISSNYSGSLQVGCDSESEVSVFFDEQTDKFVKLSKIAGVVRYSGGQLDSTNTGWESRTEE